MSEEVEKTQNCENNISDNTCSCHSCEQKTSNDLHDVPKNLDGFLTFIEENIPWNGIMIGIIMVFLFLTFFINK